MLHHGYQITDEVGGDVRAPVVEQGSRPIALTVQVQPVVINSIVQIRHVQPVTVVTLAHLLDEA